MFLGGLNESRRLVYHVEGKGLSPTITVLMVQASGSNY